ncbi:phosphomannomutase/phosphoglucomutase [Phycicoccus endophyticus]|uniref:Phosphomannomutase/phosphoglucomutase n=1 Tax=Phycicoccus endophyticus TaxID=1690220 RepID=A0A7G9R345_9MICO|nr:phosphomannomutase/phosphoglucomutase [Phycicoccus endophyticus]NHI20315.1 phosphomannomutase/phosphoglucomutase [Phycicoccus endophyticus]QNN50020.1 phosphomannomutase/phosphoglucomutase [Phycicoccus endophyticus]GGL28821.1 phosphomannomutase/phosphoglucomutase [Phycicoccus endophyticus]
MTHRSLADVVKAYDVRGIVPDQLDEEVARALGAAFAEVVLLPEGADGALVGHDMRESGPALVEAFGHGVRSRGLEVTVIGLCSTDGLYYASGDLGLPGAMFTASHNPARYNGVKLCRGGAAPVGRDSGLTAIRELAERMLAGEVSDPDVRTGARGERDLLPDYAAFLRGLVDLSGIRPLRVVVDAGNGMAGLTVPAVLEDAAGLAPLPLSVERLYFELDGTFPHHEANPLEPENLRDLQAAVRAHGADLGLAFDGDADRCFVVDERGEPVSPSAITALIARREVARAVAEGATPGDIAVVHNLICSAQVPQVVTAAGARPVRTRVGHSFVKAEMARNAAVFGGEHSAHYYFRDFWYADTGMLAAMHVLAALGEQDGPLSALMADLSRYHASGEVNSTVADVEGATEAVLAWGREQGADVDRLDGLTLRRAGAGEEAMWWLNVRPSNTEPVLRLNVESDDAGTMARVRDTVLDIIRR